MMSPAIPRRLRPIRHSIVANNMRDPQAVVFQGAGPRDPAMRHARACYNHLAGELGVALLSRIIALKWARRDKGSRIIRFSPQGERALAAWLG